MLAEKSLILYLFGEIEKPKDRKSGGFCGGNGNQRRPALTLEKPLNRSTRSRNRQRLKNGGSGEIGGITAWTRREPSEVALDGIMLSKIHQRNR